MANEKHTTRPFITKLVRTSITLDKSTELLALELKKIHAAGSMSTYIRGLIALDALQTKGPLDITAVPAWIIVAYKLDVMKGKVQPSPIHSTDKLTDEIASEIERAELALARSKQLRLEHERTHEILENNSHKFSGKGHPAVKHPQKVKPVAT